MAIKCLMESLQWLLILRNITLTNLLCSLCRSLSRYEPFNGLRIKISKIVNLLYLIMFWWQPYCRPSISRRRNLSTVRRAASLRRTHCRRIRRLKLLRPPRRRRRRKRSCCQRILRQRIRPLRRHRRRYNSPIPTGLISWTSKRWVIHMYFNQFT